MKKTFNPVRLKSARMYRAKTIDQLAKETNVNKKDILAFEESKYLPVPENVSKLAKGLNFPEDYLYEKDNMKVLIDNTHFQIPGSMLRVDEVASREKLITTHKIYNLLEENLKEMNLPTSVSRNIDAETLASEVRSFWNLGDGRIEHLVEAIEENGIIISHMNSKVKNATPFTQKQSVDGDVRYIIALGNDGDIQPKRNYELAYELCHIVTNSLGLPAKKISKDEFACAFLLPKEAIMEDLKNVYDLEGYLKLKKKWKVPVSVILFRAYQLGVLSYKKHNTLEKEMQVKGWFKEEPFDKSMKAKNAQILSNGINKFKNREIDRYLSSLNMSVSKDDVEKLFN